LAKVDRIVAETQRKAEHGQDKTDRALAPGREVRSS
jgi:hypothetical protein